MDRNTVTGLLLMAAIFFGFMYCNRNTQQQIQEQQTAQTDTNGQESTKEEQIIPDSISPQLKSSLINAVATAGTRSADNSYNLTSQKYELTAAGDTLSGNIMVGNTSIDVAALMAHSDTVYSPDQRRLAITELNSIVNNSQKYKSLSRYLDGKDSTVVLQNELVKLSISSRGAMIKDVELKKYETEVGKNPGPIHIFQGENDGYSFILSTNDQRIDTRDFTFLPVVESDTSLIMQLTMADGASWAIRYSLHPDSYIVGMEIIQQNIGSLLPTSTASADFKWHQTMARNEKGRSFEERNSAIYYKYIGDSPDDMSEMGDDSENLTGRIKWVAFKNQFFSSVIIPREYFTTAELNSKVLKDDPTFLKDMEMAASFPYNINNGTVASFDWYFGPNDYPLLSQISKTLDPEENLDLTRLIPLGWGLFRYINTWIVIPVFTFLSSFISNYGIIILLLTIFIKIIIFPFTFKSYKSQARMRVLQPEIKEINEKYPGKENAMKRQQETMALYSRSGASPFSGCLPLLFQMPILIAMFSFFPSAIELRGESFLWAKDLAAPDYVLTLPFTIPFYGNGVSLFCLLMTAVNIIYMKINMQNQPGGSAMPGMKWMSYIMPIMFLFIFNDYASGLSYYYFLSLLITILQTWIIRKFIVDEKKVREQMLANAKKPRKKSGLMARLEEAQRRQQAALRQQQAAQGKGKNKNR